MLERLWSPWRSTYVRDLPPGDAVVPGTTDDEVAGEDRGPGADVGGAAGGGGDARDRTAGDAGGAGASVFTAILRSGLPDTETHIVHRGPTCFVIVNAYPYSSGHLLVLPYREVAELELLTDDEHAELWATTTTAVAAVRIAYRPAGLNIGMNLGRPAGGSVPTHLHVHVVPRWTGDSNFLTAVSNTRTLPEALAVTAQRVRRAWSEVSTDQRP